MVIKVQFPIDDTWISYDVEKHVDGLFIAKVIAPIGRLIPYHIPQKIFMYRTPAGWKGDHNRKDIIDTIGLQIDKVIKQ